MVMFSFERLSPSSLHTRLFFLLGSVSTHHFLRVFGGSLFSASLLAQRSKDLFQGGLRPSRVSVFPVRRRYSFSRRPLLFFDFSLESVLMTKIRGWGEEKVVNGILENVAGAL
jgi:hypothetical protein